MEKLSNTAFEDKVQELQERSLGEKSQNRGPLFLLWSHIRSAPKVSLVSLAVFLNFEPLN